MLPVRSLRLWLALSLLLLPVTAPAEDLPLSISETVVFHPLERDLAKVCRTASRVTACTATVAQALRSRCVRCEEGWKLAIEADLELVIHAIDAAPLAHERLHVADMRRHLPRELESVLAMRFSREDRCAQLARLTASPSFVAELMNVVRSGSNRRLGCTRSANEWVASARRAKAERD